MTIPTTVAEVSVLTAAHDPFNPADPIDLTGPDGALYFENASDLVVYYISLAGAATLLELGADYEINGEGMDGEGTITPTFNFAEAGGTLHVSRSTPLTQEANYEENDGFPAAVHEGVEDRNRLIDQDLKAQILRAIRMPRHEDAIDPLPVAADRASKFMWFNDAGELVLVDGSGYTDEMARDAIGAALVAGAGVDIVINDAGDTITIGLSGGGAGYTDEQARDAIGAALVAGAGISIVVNDGADTITIACSEEFIQDTFANILADDSDIDFTYDDVTPKVTAAIKPARVTNAQLANAAAWSIKLRNAGAAGSVTDAAVGDLTEEPAPAAGDFLLGFLNTGEIRKFDVGNLPGGVGGYTDEQAQDAVGSILNANDFVYNDAAPSIRIASPIYPPFTTPVGGDFAWINQGTASIATNANGGIYLSSPPQSGVSLKIRKKAAPATPYTITACFLMNLIAVDFQRMGLLWRQSSDGKLVTYNYAVGNTAPGDFQFQSLDYNSPTLFSAVNTTASAIASGLVWLRIEDDGVNRKGAWSFDGYNFTAHLSEGRTTFMTGNEVGFFVSAEDVTSPASCTLLSWAQS